MASLSVVCRGLLRVPDFRAGCVQQIMRGQGSAGGGDEESGTLAPALARMVDWKSRMGGTRYQVGTRGRKNMQDQVPLRQTFDQVAELYDEARPGYPEALFDDVVVLSGIPQQGRILEIGCGTGQATIPMARRGYHLLCIELGANLAAVARRNARVYPEVQVQTVAFEDWPIEEGAFDLALSATAFHWIDPAIAYQKTAQALKPSGAIALFWHVHVQSEASHGFFEEVQQIYRPLVPEQEEKYGPLLWPHEVAEPEQTGLFGEVAVRRYHWDVTYDAASYLRLLDTYSNHRILEKPRYDRLFHEIADLINTRYHGHITKGYLADLYVAHRK